MTTRPSLFSILPEEDKWMTDFFESLLEEAETYQVAFGDKMKISQPTGTIEIKLSDGRTLVLSPSIQ
ncbi:hypothetical protein BH23THE1_BH23THE1_35060 [soil metagenome]